MVASLAAFLTLGTISPVNRRIPSTERTPSDLETGTFPITVDFDCPRNFGFHIGDEIPVTVTLEAKEGIIVDLVNLPQKGEKHGPFEVRDLRVVKGEKNGRTVHTVFYRLQSFQPAVAVDTLDFPPLRISYATKTDWNSMESRYHYRNLFSQPFRVFVSRTASYFGPIRDIKGPIKDSKVNSIWKAASAMGSLLVFVTLITWPWAYLRKRWAVKRESPNITARDRALKALQEARERCFNYEDHRQRLFFEINGILRDFLRDACSLGTANRPSMEIVNQLKDLPCYEELKSLATRVNQVVYEGDAPVDVESTMRQFSGLLAKIDGIPHPGVNHDKAG